MLSSFQLQIKSWKHLWKILKTLIKELLSSTLWAHVGSVHTKTNVWTFTYIFSQICTTTWLIPFPKHHFTNMHLRPTFFETQKYPWSTSWVLSWKYFWNSTHKWLLQVTPTYVRLICKQKHIFEETQFNIRFNSSGGVIICQNMQKWKTIHK